MYKELWKGIYKNNLKKSILKIHKFTKKELNLKVNLKNAVLKRNRIKNVAFNQAFLKGKSLFNLHFHFLIATPHTYMSYSLIDLLSHLVFPFCLFISTFCYPLGLVLLKLCKTMQMNLPVSPTACQQLLVFIIKPL